MTRTLVDQTDTDPLDEDAYGEAAELTITLHYGLAVETAPDAENLKQAATDLVGSIRDAVVSAVEQAGAGDWRVVITAQGAALD